MGNKVYMVTEEESMSAVYYVAADNEDDALEYLRKQIKKYFFKTKLSNKPSDSPDALGDYILVDGFLTESVASTKTTLTALDITAMAWVYKETNREGWDKFDVDMLDAVDA